MEPLIQAMKYFSVLLFSLISLQLSSQEGCKLPRPYKHYCYIPNITSEQAGVYLNGYNISKHQFQLEVNSLVGAFNNSYGSPVYTALIAARYGLNDNIEVQVKTGHFHPSELNADTLFNSYFSLGFKFKITEVIRPNLKWNLSINASSFAKRSTEYARGLQSSNGADLSINNSFQYYKLLHFDLSLGVYAQYNGSSSPQGEMSSRIMLKDEKSKVGLFIGIVGDHYFESMVNMGLQITNNNNYVLLLSMAALDKAIAPNVAYTYKFTH